MDSKNEKQGFKGCQIILMGLPYSGKKEVALILQNQFGCEIIEEQTELKESMEKQQLKKFVTKCFEDYNKKIVVVMSKCNEQFLHSMKKRNFTNVIFVDSTPKNRLEYFRSKKNIPKSKLTLQLYDEFLQLDSQYQNEAYFSCLQHVRIRLLNNGTKQDLFKNVSDQIHSIIRPFRPDWDQYFMKMADIARRRSNCMKSSVGAVIVNNNNRVVSTGYNGTPQGLKSCFQNGCERCNKNLKTNLDECRCLHGEESAIMQVGINKTSNCKLYTTMYPCFSCAKVIKQAGIKQIFYMEQYKKHDSGERFLKANFPPQNIKQIKVNHIYY